MLISISSPLKAITLLACILQFIVLRAVLHIVAPDASADWNVLLMLVAGTLTIAELILAGHLLNIDSLKIDLHDRAARLGAAGIGLAYALAIGLLIFHSADRRQAEGMRQQSDEVRAITRQAEHDAAAIDPSTMKMIQQRAAERQR